VSNNSIPENFESSETFIKKVTGTKINEMDITNIKHIGFVYFTMSLESGE